MAVVAVNSLLDVRSFIDDMLQYVYERYGYRRTSLLSNNLRELRRMVSDPVYIFSPVIGDAVIHIHASFFNMGEHVIYFCETYLRHLPNQHLLPGLILTLHRAASLTNDDFASDPTWWCSIIIQFLAYVTALCVFYELVQHHHPIRAIKDFASGILHRIMSERGGIKRLLLDQYARDSIQVPPIAEYCIYDMF